jgi:menaquinone-dependent protoporphyrinogen IX oxidase
VKGLVVYHTKFGNCKRIAESIAGGLEEAGLEVEVIPSETRKVSSEYDFVAVGSGTRMGRMTGAIKRFINREIKREAWEGKPFQAFGTGGKPKEDGSKHDDWNCAGAGRIHEALEARGLKPVAAAARFYIQEEGLKGPLREGEEERAYRLGLETGRRLLARGG